MNLAKYQTPLIHLHLIGRQFQPLPHTAKQDHDANTPTYAQNGQASFPTIEHNDLQYQSSECY